MSGRRPQGLGDHVQLLRRGAAVQAEGDDPLRVEKEIGVIARLLVRLRRAPGGGVQPLHRPGLPAAVRSQLLPAPLQQPGPAGVVGLAGQPGEVAVGAEGVLGVSGVGRQGGAADLRLIGAVVLRCDGEAQVLQGYGEIVVKDVQGNGPGIIPVGLDVCLRRFPAHMHDAGSAESAEEDGRAESHDQSRCQGEGEIEPLCIVPADAPLLQMPQNPPAQQHDAAVQRQEGQERGLRSGQRRVQKERGQHGGAEGHHHGGEPQPEAGMGPGAGPAPGHGAPGEQDPGQIVQQHPGGKDGDPRHQGQLRQLGTAAEKFHGTPELDGEQRQVCQRQEQQQGVAEDGGLPHGAADGGELHRLVSFDGRGVGTDGAEILDGAVGRRQLPPGGLAVVRVRLLPPGKAGVEDGRLGEEGDGIAHPRRLGPAVGEDPVVHLLQQPPLPGHPLQMPGDGLGVVGLVPAELALPVAAHVRASSPYFT